MNKQISDKLKEKNYNFKGVCAEVAVALCILKYYITDPTRINLNVVNYWPIFRHYGGQRLNRLKPQFITAHTTDIQKGGSAQFLSAEPVRNQPDRMQRQNKPTC